MIERSALYPKSYDSWAGNPKGSAPDYTRCCAEVWSRERFSRHYQCNKPRGHGPDGAYCKQHNPAAAEARKNASDARSKDRWNKIRYEIHGKEFFDTLVKIADGYNDARGLAREVIETFRAGEN